MQKGCLIGENEDIEAIPFLQEPGQHGSADASRAEKANLAASMDCNPIQNGVAKLMCDLYCSEEAVKEGYSVIVRNIQNRAQC